MIIVCKNGISDVVYYDSRNITILDTDQLGLYFCSWCWHDNNYAHNNADYFTLYTQIHRILYGTRNYDE